MYLANTTPSVTAKIVRLPALPWYCRGNRNAVRRQDRLFLTHRPGARRVHPSPILAARLAAWFANPSVQSIPMPVSAAIEPTKTRDWSGVVNSIATLVLLAAIVLVCLGITHLV